ncbi:MAG: flagellar basal-body MS-ring/collar protein FliF [Vicinamibacterales bacterium]
MSPSQRASLAAAFAVVVLVMGGSTYWLNRTDYALLFADVDPEAANDIVTKLKAQKVAYQLDNGGRAIRVPASRVDELRLEFTSGGLPSSGRIGFEIFDRTAFGATEFLEQINYRRALEGEIARTIGTISEVAGARVHIAMARTSLFASKEQPAKASVVLKLRGNRPLSNGIVQGIANLVASSVEGLRPEAVVILDSFGRPLAKPAGSDDEPAGGMQMERQQQIERDLTTKVASLLEPVVGANRARVNVSVRLDAQSEEATEEKWDPNSAVIRSRQATGDVAGGGATVQGLAGSRANLPGQIPVATAADTAKTPATADGTATTPPATPVPAAAQSSASAALPMPSRGSETTNYEISKVVRHTIRPRGEIARLSVAVILDNESVETKNADGTTAHSTRSRKPEDVQKIQSLVAAAVGLDAARGDLLTIENVPFEEIPVDVAPTPTMWQKVAPQAYEGGRVLGVVALAALAFFMFVKPLMRRATVTTVPVETPSLPEYQARTVRDLEGVISAQLDAAADEKSAERMKLPVLTKRLAQLSAKEPEHAARLIRMWMSQENR